MDRPQQSVLHAKEQKHSHGPSHGSQRRNFKLIVDPQLKKGQEKLIRFDGEFYSSNVSINFVKSSNQFLNITWPEMLGQSCRVGDEVKAMQK